MKLLAVVLFVATAACGQKPGGTTPGGATGVLPDVPFEQLDHDQRIQFMKEKVVPTMSALFQKHDPEKYKGFDCKTCHGKAAEKGEFHMPNDGLPKLNFSDMSKFKPADIEWMKSEIKPQMAKLLREPEFAPDNPQGFGCLHCHTAEGK
jgi:hypothetical protein